MNILYIVKNDPKDSMGAILEEHKNKESVTIVDLREDDDYGKLIKHIETSDKIICI